MTDPPYVLPGADYVPRLRRRCALCGRVRLTVETTLGPCCNDCLAAARTPA